MKKYLIDQMIFLAIGVALMLCIPRLWGGTVFSIVYELSTVLSWGFLCRRILLLPLDLIVGRTERVAYFSGRCGREDLEFFRGEHCDEWKFYYGDRQTLRLLVPATQLRNKQHVEELPKPDARLKLTYWRFSGLLLEWETLQSKSAKGGR